MPPEVVWRALHEVDLLRQTLPDCESLEQTAPDTFSGVARIGIAVIKGRYTGHVTLSEEQEPQFLRISVEAHSGHAQIKGNASVTLEPDGAGTCLTYDGEAHLHGPLAAVGQRLLPVASKTMAARFFGNLERKLSEAPVPK